MTTKIDLAQDSKFGLEGRIITLNDQSEVIQSGVLYIDGDKIVAIRKSNDPAPNGFSKQRVIKVGGTIYPGLIELHNHLSYNIVPLWIVPKLFVDRDQWRRHNDYRKKMTGPLEILGHIDGYLQAIVRYVETRLLFSGVTTSQGITLASHQNIRRLYKGIVRNVEQPIDSNLKDLKAGTRIADVKTAQKFLDRLDYFKASCLLLHLCEGIPERVNKHFKALQIDADKWAITNALAGIHAVGLRPEDIEILGRFEGSVIWSPMSNLILYGTTADMETIKANNILTALGSDWTASGSKNLLCELKVAKIVNDEKGGIFSDEELVRMVTSNAAKILKWDKYVGSLEDNKKADCLVISGKTGDPYKKLIEAKESQVSFLCIDGIPRAGQKRMMDKFTFDDAPEKADLDGRIRYLHLKNEEMDNPIDIKVSFADAEKKLKEGLDKLPEYAKDVETTSSGIFAGAADKTNPKIGWFIESEHQDWTDSTQRHHLPYEGKATGGKWLTQFAEPLSKIVEPIPLDKPTVINDDQYFNRIASQQNLPEYIKLKLPSYYGVSIDLSDTNTVSKKIINASKNRMVGVTDLASFYSTPGYLNLSDKLKLIDQAKTLFNQAYVHLPLKKAKHASNPIQQLAVLRDEILNSTFPLREIEFHKEMIRIFNSVRDLHTSYYLPAPFNGKVAFLPFFIEEYFEEDEPHYIISKIVYPLKNDPFTKGVEVIAWNGIPIQRAIKINSDRYAGSNESARHVRGLDSMTFRPLAMMLAPEEEVVKIDYFDKKRKRRSKTFKWMVASNLRDPRSEDQFNESKLSSGYDYFTHLVHEVKKSFFAPKKFRKRYIQKKGLSVFKSGNYMYREGFELNFKARLFFKNNQQYGYIRLFSFNTDDPDAFASAFRELLKVLPDKVIIDIRNNGGGDIRAAEYILQVLSKKKIIPQSAQFINSNLTEYLCHQHSPSKQYKELNLCKWQDTFRDMRQTGADYTLGFPITSPKELAKYRSKEKKDLVLIVDALCYSAADIFAAGFQDHRLGKVIGAHENTGAGGANVWTHSILHELTTTQAQQSAFFSNLPYGANFRVAIRRTLRVGPNENVPIEDLGIKPDEVIRYTKKDLLMNNEDFIDKAIQAF